MRVRLEVFYSGKVQGVGFRATVRHLACGYEVVGTVKNLVDGRVELVAEGEKTELEAFLTEIDQSGLSDLISLRKEEWKTPQGNFRGFVILADS